MTSSKSPKKRACRFYNQWRMESLHTYGAQLSAAEREWLDKFEREYYCGEWHELHSEEYRKELYQQNNAAARDIVTASSRDVEKQLKLVDDFLNRAKDPEKVTRYYHPNDYPDAD